QAQKKLFYKMGRLRDLEEGEGSMDERVKALAEELDVGVEEVEQMYERIRGRDLSLDARVGEEQETTFMDFLADFAPNQEERLADKERREIIKRMVEEALEQLSQRERTVVEKRLMAEEPMTLQELGQVFNVSRERVRQIELSALKKLKQSLERGKARLSSE
ncbi:MAG: RNA polymerase subunit sigma-70, partial [Deltaproteobacteria bacterium]